MAHGWKWKRIWDPVFLGRIVLRYRIDLLRRIFSWIRTWVWTNYDAGSSSQLVCHFLRVQSGTQGGPKPPPTSITTFLHHIVTYRQRKHQAIDPILLFLPLSLLLLRTYVLTGREWNFLGIEAQKRVLWPFELLVNISAIITENWGFCYKKHRKGWRRIPSEKIVSFLLFLLKQTRKPPSFFQSFDEI